MAPRRDSVHPSSQQGDTWITNPLARPRSRPRARRAKKVTASLEPSPCTTGNVRSATSVADASTHGRTPRPTTPGCFANGRHNGSAPTPRACCAHRVAVGDFVSGTCGDARRLPTHQTVRRWIAKGNSVRRIGCPLTRLRGTDSPRGLTRERRSGRRRSEDTDGAGGLTPGCCRRYRW